MNIWILIIIVNTVLALVYGVYKGVRHEGFGMAFFFIFVPVIGFILYFIPVIVQMFSERLGVDREAVLTHVFDIDLQPEHPNMQEALNVVPIEDAMAISGNSEKRSLLLKQLEKDLNKNYKLLLSAEQDEDSESAHYIAAAKMEIYRLHQARWLECRRDYEEDPQDPELFHLACAVLNEVLTSDVFSSREQAAYRRRLCEVMERQMGIDLDEILPEEYEAYLCALVDLGLTEQAERLWVEQADHLQTEESYNEMLKLFYRQGDRAKFEDVLDHLRRNRNLRLSPAGLEHLRYWSSRLNESGVQHG